MSESSANTEPENKMLSMKMDVVIVAKKESLKRVFLMPPLVWLKRVSARQKAPFIIVVPYYCAAIDPVLFDRIGQPSFCVTRRAEMHRMAAILCAKVESSKAEVKENYLYAINRFLDALSHRHMQKIRLYMTNRA